MKKNNILLGVRFAPILMALAALCISAAAYENNTSIVIESCHENSSYEEAINVYDEILRMDPENANAWQYRGEALEMQGRLDEAKQSFEKAMEASSRTIEKDPKNVEALWQKARSLQSLNRLEEAIGAFEQILVIDPGNADAWVNKAFSLRCLKRYNESIEAYDKAIEMIQSNATARLIQALELKAFVLRESGRQEEAVKAYDKVIELDPKNVDAWVKKAGALQKLGMQNEANMTLYEATEIIKSNDLPSNWTKLVMPQIGAEGSA